MFEFVFFGDFAPDQIIAGWEKSTHSLPRGLRSSIQSAWNKVARKRGRSLFDGPMCRLESWTKEGTRLYLKFSRTSYKWFWGTNLTRSELPETQLANGLGLSAVLESADGHLVFGRRNAKVAYHPNRIHPFAGSATDKDVFAEMRRELAEELALTGADIADIRCIGMAKDQTIRQPELVFLVRSTLKLAQIKGRMDHAEHRAIWSMRNTPAAIERASSNKKLTPIAVAALGLRAVYRSESQRRRDLGRAIGKAERLLPGKPVASGPDPRWQAMLTIGGFIPWHPEPIWQFVLRWGKHPQADLRSAIGVVLLEHLLADHFNLLFPRVRQAALASRRFTDTLRRCYWIGEAAWPSSADALDRLAGVRRDRFRPRRPAVPQPN